MTAFNYLPNEFAELGETVSDENEGDTPAKRGTYRFYIDTLTMEEWSQSENLNHLLQPDGSWHLTMYIPPVFSACSVYVQYQNQEYIGSIDRYNIEYYTNYSSPSEFDDTISHKTATNPLFIDIPISSDNKYSRECTVTIHYETDNENFVGITSGILIGAEAEVQKAVAQNRSILLIGAIIGGNTVIVPFNLYSETVFFLHTAVTICRRHFFRFVFYIFALRFHDRSVFVTRTPPLFRGLYTLRFHAVSSEENR